MKLKLLHTRIIFTSALVASLVINKRTKVCEQPHRHLKSLQIFGKRASLALRLLNFTRSLLRAFQFQQPKNLDWSNIVKTVSDKQLTYNSVQQNLIKLHLISLVVSDMMVLLNTAISSRQIQVYLHKFFFEKKKTNNQIFFLNVYFLLRL